MDSRAGSRADLSAVGLVAENEAVAGIKNRAHYMAEEDPVVNTCLY